MAEDTASADVNTTEVADTSTNESSAVETQNSDGDDFASIMDEALTSTEESEETVESADTQEEAGEDAEEEPSESQEESDSAEPQSAADKRKEQLNTEIRELVEQRKQAEREYQEYQAYLQAQQQQGQQTPQGENQPQTVEEYLDTVNPDTGEYYTPAEAKLAVMERQLEVMQQREHQQQYEQQVESSQKQIESDAQRVVQEFPLFNPESEEYNQALANSAAEILKANLVTDQTGRIVGSRISPYQLYKSLADAHTTGTHTGQVQGQKATAKMMNSVDMGSNSSKRESEESKFISTFFD